MATPGPQERVGVLLLGGNVLEGAGAPVPALLPRVTATPSTSTACLFLRQGPPPQPGHGTRPFTHKPLREAPRPSPQSGSSPPLPHLLPASPAVTGDNQNDIFNCSLGVRWEFQHGAGPPPGVAGSRPPAPRCLPGANRAPPDTRRFHSITGHQTGPKTQ